MQYLILVGIIIKVIQITFDFYKHPQKAKQYINLLMLSLMIILVIVLFLLSPLVFNKQESILTAYSAFIVFIMLTGGSLWFANFFYKELKDSN